MEGTQPAAAATRKRRSSILKSLRPPRTPFSELEFNVATPTDPGKSRRVSFSRRTGVAEFVKNEATTTWRNVYEEQNKSLESSGHDSHHAPAATMFDRQFQEMEAEVDFAGDVRAVHTSTLGISVTDQFAMFENTADEPHLVAPQHAHENTEFTEGKSRIFKDDLTSAFNDLTDRVDVNFSNVKDLANDDDLDDIVNDLQESRPDAECAGLFSGRNASQYIEIDFNVTQGLVKVDGDNESDMSITATIQSPKKELSVVSNTDLKICKDLSSRVADDKENIVVNPYVPADIDYSTHKDESQKVLVFDGKKLKYADIHDDLDDILDKSTNPPRTSNQPQLKRNTIVFDSNTEEADVSVTHCITNVVMGNANQTRNFTDEIFTDMSITQAVPESRRETDQLFETTNNKENERGVVKDMEECNKTKLFDKENHIADVSMTEAVIGNVIKPNCKRQTIVFDSNDIDADISVTKCIPNLVFPETDKTSTKENKNDEISFTRIFSESTQFKQVTDETGNNKRKTIVFDGNDIEADISMTKCIPNLVFNTSKAMPDTAMPKRQTIVFQTDDVEADISMTKAIPNLVLEKSGGVTDKIVPKRQTIVFETDDIEADVSMTKVIPNLVLERHEGVTAGTNILKRQTTVFESNNLEADISVTKALPNLVLEKSEAGTSGKTGPKRQTIIFESNDIEADISVTKAIPNLVLGKPGDISSDKMASKRQTILFKTDDIEADVSVTKPLPNLVLGNPEVVSPEKKAPKRQTIVFQTDDIEADVSVTKPIPNLVIDKSQIEVESPSKVAPKRQTTVYENDDIGADVSMTRCIPNVLYEKTNAEILAKDNCYTNSNPDKRKTIVYDADDIDADLSVTRGIPNLLLNRSNRGIEVYNVTVTKDDAKRENTVTNIDGQNPIQGNVRKSIARQKRLEESGSEFVQNVDESPEKRRVSEVRPGSVHWEVDDGTDMSQTRLDELLTGDNEDSALIDVDNLKDDECMSYVAASRKKSTSPKCDSNDATRDRETHDVSVGNSENADDTNDILNAISDLTDKTATDVSINDATQTTKADTHAPISIIDTTTDIGTSTKKVQAHIENDEAKSVTFNDTTVEKAASFARHSRVSHEIVKTLDFSEDADRSPLRKRPKAHVIPDYGIRDEVKELMDDLVKPMADVPFTMPNFAPTRNSEIQANISRVSSQAEVMTESYEAKKLASEIALLGNATISSALERGMTDQKMSVDLIPVESVKSIRSTYAPEAPEKDFVLWDNANPLNNVLIKSPDTRLKVHKYNPIHKEYLSANVSAVTIDDQPHIIPTPSMTLLYRDASKDSGAEKRRTTFSDPDVATQKHVVVDDDKPKSLSNYDVSGDATLTSSVNDPSAAVAKTDSVTSKKSKSCSRRNSTENKPLEEAMISSDDEALAPKREKSKGSKCSHRKCSDESAPEESPKKEKKSRDSIFKRLSNIVSSGSGSEKRKRRSSADVAAAESHTSHKKNTDKSKKDKDAKRTVSYVDLVDTKEDAVSSQEERQDERHSKRSVSYIDITEADKSSAKDVMRVETTGNPFAADEGIDVLRVELSPVQVNKVRKLSSSPEAAQVLFRGTMTGSENSSLNEAMENAPSIETIGSIGRSVMVANIDLEAVPEKAATPREIVEINDTRDAVSCVESEPMKVDSPAELESQEDGRIEEVVPRALAPSVDQYENLLAKIDLLPFMGTEDCAWVSRAPPLLVFRLMRGRVELRAALGGGGGGGAEMSVCDVEDVNHTPVTRLATAHLLSTLRVQCACSQPDVLRALRAAAAAARAAGRWARAMHDAACRLALDVRDEGVVMKVANVPLRSVWEVTFTLTPARPTRACHPRVSHARAAAVVGAPGPALGALVAAVEDDWGHVPRTVWKVFRYLKNLRRDDD